MTEKIKLSTKAQLEALTQRFDALEVTVKTLLAQNEDAHREIYSKLSAYINEQREELVSLRDDLITERQNRRNRAARAKELFGK